MKLLAISILVIILTAVGGYYYVNYYGTISTPLESEELAEALFLKLEENNVWHVKEGKAKIRFRKADTNELMRLGLIASQELLPSRLSIAPAPELLEEAKLKLFELGVEYRVKTINNETWLIVKSGNEKVIKCLLVAC